MRKWQIYTFFTSPVSFLALNVEPLVMEIAACPSRRALELIRAERSSNGSHAQQHLSLAEDEFCVNAVCDGSIDEKGAAGVQDFITVIVVNGLEMKNSTGIHINRVQTPDVGTRLPAQNCVKTVGSETCDQVVM